MVDAIQRRMPKITPGENCKKAFHVTQDTLRSVSGRNKEQKKIEQYVFRNEKRINGCYMNA